jgi:hypothetical protein
LVDWWRVVLPVLVVVVAALGFWLLTELNLQSSDDRPTITTPPPTLSTTPPTGGPPTTTPARTTLPPVRTYDLDGDRRADYAAIEGSLVSVPVHSSARFDWAPVWGVVGSVIGAVALIVVAMLNREGGRRVKDLEDRLDAADRAAQRRSP